MKPMFLKGMNRIMLAAAMLAAPVVLSAETTSAAVSGSEEWTALAKKVRKELVTLPFYGVFDNMAFRIEDGTVTLLGQVSRPTLRSSAENVVKRLEGVHKVVNQIEVLPLSPFDNRIRLATLYTLYGYPALQRYGWGTQPSIRIIVKNGEITLEGVVSNEADKNIAFLRANGVSGAFKVHNNLRVEKSKKA